MIGGEMTGFDDFTMRLITNEAVLAMHARSRNARQIFRRKTGGTEYILWAAEDCTGGRYIAAFNAGEQDGEFAFALEELEDIPTGSLATELWSGETVTIGEEFRIEAPAHGAKVFRIG